METAGLSAALSSLDDDRLERLRRGAEAAGSALSWDSYAAAVERAIHDMITG